MGLSFTWRLVNCVHSWTHPHPPPTPAILHHHQTATITWAIWWDLSFFFWCRVFSFIFGPNHPYCLPPPPTPTPTPDFCYDWDNLIKSVYPWDAVFVFILWFCSIWSKSATRRHWQRGTMRPFSNRTTSIPGLTPSFFWTTWVCCLLSSGGAEAS